MRRGNRGPKNNNPMNSKKPVMKTQKTLVRLSKKLSYILRHGAIKEGYTIDEAGFVMVEEILSNQKFQNATFELIKEVVETNNKKRFELVQDETTEEWKIRAVQGHSITTINNDEIYEKITDPNEIPACIHGTYKKPWRNFIRFSGLKKMGRTHIHFAIGLPGDKGVISGMRNTADVVIVIDVAKAMADGYVFERAKNDVVLCAGKGPDGCLPPSYFKEVLFRVGKEYQTVAPVTYPTLLVLDFEANCIENAKLECQEIIEFPVVPISTLDIKPVCEPFHTYVKPTVVPEITEFCTELTGITQDVVDEGMTIDQALVSLNDWMKLNDFTAENSVFVTCGMWDLNTCLKKEAEYKKLSILPYLKKYINVKDIWMQVMFKNKAKGMPGMLESLELELIGKHHSGIDDSQNIARIAIELLKKNGTFTQFQERIAKPSKDKNKKKANPVKMLKKRAPKKEEMTEGGE